MSETSPLYQFMQNLFAAGMSIESVIERGLEFARGMIYLEDEKAKAYPIVDVDVMARAAKLVREASEQMGIDRAMVRRRAMEHKG